MRKNKGQMLAFFAITWAIFVVGLVSVFNIGTLIGERIRIQQIADNAAYSGAVWESRCLNFIAYCNRAIVADISFLAYLTAAESHLKAWKDLLKYIRMVPYVGIAISSAVSPILTYLEELVKIMRRSPMWEYSMTSLSAAETFFEFYISNYLHIFMNDVVKDADSKANLNSQYSLYINKLNHTAILDKGKRDDLIYVTNETLSNWTKGIKEGQTPIYNRSYLALPRSFENWLKWTLSICNGGVFGSISLDNKGIKSTDYPYLVYYKWKRLKLRRKTWIVGPIRYANQKINWDRILFYKFKGNGTSNFGWFNRKKNTSVGIYAEVEKNPNSLTPLIFMEFLRAPFGANKKGMFSVPKTGLGVLRGKAKAVARYEDPEPYSGRHSYLSKRKKEPNLFNPFWHAELVALEGISEEDAYPSFVDWIIRDDYGLKKH